KAVPRTGQITLRARIHAIGGLKEKALAAERAGTKISLTPKATAKDLREIPLKIRRELTIIPVEHVDEVMRHALLLENPDAFFRQPAPEPPKMEAPGNTPQTAV